MDKVLLIICDGVSDRPIRELSDKTPLEAAYKPNLDKLATQGLTGLMHTVDIGVRPGSDIAHLSLFGYDPAKYYSGRGPLEALGLGIDLAPTDVAFRANFATVDSNFKIIDRRAGRIDKTKPLVSALNGMTLEGVKILVVKGTGHRAAVVFRGKNLSAKISDVDPHSEGVKIAKSCPLAKTVAAQKTARLVNLFTLASYEILSKLSTTANILLLRGAGSLPILPSFAKKYGFSAACIAGAGLYKGIARLIGMDIVNVPGASGTPQTDIKAKINKAIQSLAKYDFIFVHIKGADVLSEDGDFFAKKKFIEKLDAAIAPLINESKLLRVITADHTTSSYLKMHTADPVPLIIVGENIHTDYVTQFGERSAAMGKLGHIQGKHLMPIILDLLGRAPLVGA